MLPPNQHKQPVDYSRNQQGHPNTEDHLTRTTCYANLAPPFYFLIRDYTFFDGPKPILNQQHASNIQIPSKVRFKSLRYYCHKC